MRQRRRSIYGGKAGVRIAGLAVGLLAVVGSAIAMTQPVSPMLWAGVIPGLAALSHRRVIGERAADSVFVRMIGRAMRNRELRLHYQPIVDLATGETTSVEALVRWRRRGGSGLRAPAEFVPRIEASTALERFNEYVLEEAIMQAARWRAEGMSLQVGVNVPLQSVRPRLVRTLERLIDAHALPTDLLQLEVTEGGISEQGFDRVAEALGGSAATLERIRALGVRIALDDFGVAHSNLARLVALPVDVLKIDRSFVIPMLEDEMSEEVVRTTIQLAHRGGLWVVAEGVETEEHMRRLGELGAGQAQGFWLGRPMPAEQLERLRRTPTRFAASPENRRRPAQPRWRVLHRAMP